MTTIQDVLTYADGSKANGRLAVFWRPFTIGNANVTGGELVYDIVDGAVLVTVYPNAGALPSGTYYSAKYELENGVVYIEQWIVPNLPTVNLGQVRVSFPPTPSILISPTQLTSMNAQPGMFLMWDGVRWVPGYPSTFNLNPNWIGINIGGLGSDVNVEGSPVSVGNYATIHIPDAGPAARGVVTTAAQTIGGPKTLQNRATISQSLLFTQHTVYTAIRGELVNIGSGAAHSLNFGGDIVALRIAGTDRTRMQADRLVSGQLDLDTIADPPTATMPGTPLSPLKGAETISLPHDGIDWAGIGMAVDGSLWLRTAGAFLYLNANGVTCRELRMDPYQHPNAVGVEAARSDATMVVYSDSTSWGGYGVDNTPQLWFRMGPNSGAAYYYFGSGGATFPGLTVTNLSVTGSLIVPPGAGLIPTYWIDGVLTGTRPILNFISGENIGITGVDVSDHNRVDITINSGGTGGVIIDPTDTKGDLIVRGADPPAAVTKLGVGTNGQVLTADNTVVTGIKWAVATVASDSSTQRLRISQGGVLKGTRQELNLIAGANVTLTVVDDVPGNNRVNVTVAVGNVGSLQSPWTSDIDAAGFKLFGAGRVAIGNSGAVLPDAGTNNLRLIVGSASLGGPLAQVNLIGNSTSLGDAMGTISFANYNSAAADKRIAAINGLVDLSTTDSGMLDFYTWSAGTPHMRMRITASGNVGIGNAATPAPSSVGGGLLSVGSMTGGPTGSVSIVGNVTAVPSEIGEINFANYALAAAEKRSAVILASTDSVGAYDNAYLAFYTMSAGALGERVRITAQGKVGIGEPNPFSVLSLRAPTDPGTLPTATQFAIGEVSNNPAYRLTLGFGVISGYWTGIIQAQANGAASGRLALNPSGGNVGIGATAPAGKLQIGDAGTGYPTYRGTLIIAEYSATLNANMGIEFHTRGDSGGTGWRISSLANATDLVFESRNASPTWVEQMRILNNGSVGIGAAPQFKFDVVGGRSTFSAANEPYAVGFRHVVTGPVFWQGSDLNGDMIFSEAGGSERMRIKATGNVGIGTNNPQTRLAVLASNPTTADTANQITVCEQSNNAAYRLALGYYIDTGVGVYKGVVQASNGNLLNGVLLLNPVGGVVGIGTTAPNVDLHVFRNGTYAQMKVESNANGESGYIIKDSVREYKLGINIAGTGAGRFGIWNTSLGKLALSSDDIAVCSHMPLGVGKTGPAYTLDVAGDINTSGGTFRVNGVPFSAGIAGMMVQINSGGANGPFTYLNFQAGLNMVLTGSVGGTGNNTFTLNIGSASDSQLKRNVESLSGGLPLIARLRPVTAEWNGLANTREGERVVSVIAQELREVIPDAVAPFRTKLRPGDNEERELLAINPMAITAHLILAVQQMERRLKALEGKVN